MTVDVQRLGKDAQKQIMEKMKRQEPVKNKYGAQKAHRGDIRFDSRKEARRFDELMALQKHGDITDLKLQPQFTLQEAYTTPDGARIRSIRYVADFSYKDASGRLVVEDVKSRATKTRVYELKRKLLRDRFGIEVTEV